MMFVTLKGKSIQREITSRLRISRNNVLTTQMAFAISDRVLSAKKAGRSQKLDKIEETKL